jgi:hypothetical protein
MQPGLVSYIAKEPLAICHFFSGGGDAFGEYFVLWRHDLGVVLVIA